ncbi:Flavonol synthase/flavanone 3-hydroxylase [Hibiscus syriacus]|uniref:Flavonol synthase/flavanone 3-hydroxylase n=1 Tax=Hibiscus syriacus TaxID=106335 RepID=A0A6A2WNJ1_HIBSY|nr:flavonol synthase/flavanone 3-hydroxylase-like [Hibiscus syriacus]XP_039047511.1 flavonol synthase/flavanone 3-hydroxylase-like [Hibiscus syriacus]KAE8661181.1 Flavonol synthase/flavanone 3-hydroxylase [Hibiscus syriacus]
MEVERVQAIVSSSLTKENIPEEFIRPEDEQPAITTFHGPIPDIPVIDFSHPDQADIVRSMANASRDWGIFQVVNHGIPLDLIQRLQMVGKQFFDLPQEEKEVYANTPGAPSLEGYGSKLARDVNRKKNWVDHLFHRIWPPNCINYQFWPKNPPSYREVNEDYAQEMRKLVDTLLKWLSMGLGFEENVLKQGAGGEEIEYLMKINYYPPCPRPDLTLGVPSHTDISLMTVLVPNEVPGLQVFKDGHWIEAEYIPGALIIHIGDQIEILSNGKYKAVQHRTTVDKEKTRMSWPVFVEPPAEYVVGPLPQFVDPQDPPKYKSKKYKDYRYCKLNKLPQ